MTVPVSASTKANAPSEAVFSRPGILEMQGRFDEAIDASQRAILFMSKDNQATAVRMLEKYLVNLQAAAVKHNDSERK